jgi:hypothetical protein
MGEISMKTPIHSGLQVSEEAYKKLGMKTGIVEPWEDGMRTDGGRGTYEWWYFDSHLDDGSKLVIIFYTKNIVNVNRSLAPMITMQYDTYDGTHYEEVLNFSVVQFSASKEGCNVCMCDNLFTGDLKSYKIRFLGKTVKAEVTLTGRVRPWRPGAGHIFFGDRNEYYFAWLPAVPEGSVEAEITINGQTKHTAGTGYHDHNWGNISMLKLMNHWYWGRARIGDYTAITSFITAEKKYGYKTFPIFMLAKNGEIIADNSLEHMTFTATDGYVDDYTKKPCHNVLIYDYDDGNTQYKITYHRNKDILRVHLADNLSKFNRTLARLSGFDGAYLRFNGTATLEKTNCGVLTENVSEPAIWELMYLGHAQK